MNADSQRQCPLCGSDREADAEAWDRESKRRLAELVHQIGPTMAAARVAAPFTAWAYDMARSSPKTLDTAHPDLGYGLDYGHPAVVDHDAKRAPMEARAEELNAQGAQGPRSREAAALALLELVEAASAADHDVHLNSPDTPGELLVLLIGPDGDPIGGEWARGDLAGACRRLLARLKGRGW